MLQRQIKHVTQWSAAQLVSVNRRKSKRFPTSQKAWIMNEGEKLCFCEIVDMSAGGAQIKISRPERFPYEFNLLIVGDTYMKNVPVSVRWRDGDRMGVLFCSTGVFM